MSSIKALCAGIAGLALAAGAVAADKPNIVIILADDYGYGSAGCYGADGKLVRTPNIDRLAKEGRRFTDANTTSSVCSPTRYSVLTGRYCWRTSLTHEVLGVFSPLHIEPTRLNMASLLKRHGYRTAAVGKWHLGYGDAQGSLLFRTDYAAELSPGPLDIGFDYHFAVPANHGDLTGVYVENRFVYGLRSGKIPAGLKLPGPDADDRELPGHVHGGGHGERPGEDPRSRRPAAEERARDGHPDGQGGGLARAAAQGPAVLPLFHSRGRAQPGHSRQGPGRPERAPACTATGFTNWIAASGASWMRSTSRAWRRKRSSFSAATTAACSGRRTRPASRRRRSRRACASTAASAAASIPCGRAASRCPSSCAGRAAFRPARRAAKWSAWSISSPRPRPSSASSCRLPDKAAEDSYNILPAMLGEAGAQPARSDLIVHSADGVFAIRQGPWKWIEGVPADDIKPGVRKARAAEFKAQLYNLQDDPAETRDVSAEHPEVVEGTVRAAEPLPRRRLQPRTAAGDSSAQGSSRANCRRWTERS